MKKILILFLLVLPGFLFSQITPRFIISVPATTSQFYTNLPENIKIINKSTGKEYLTLKSIPSTYSINDCVLGIDLKLDGTVTKLSVLTNNGITKTLTDSTSTPVLTLGLGAITPTSVAATGTVS